ncbi:hypothetical protein BDZ89DRAFT_1064360 [Hymenopellis radicata]|nr:hypothetical protein BDZ89DRAFT_1064360 [Hymenopellis radicata]
MCATALRSFAEWESVPPALSLRHTLPVVLIRIGDAPRRIMVLEFTRVIAGPVAGRTLAAYGADVLLVTSPKLVRCRHFTREENDSARLDDGNG